MRFFIAAILFALPAASAFAASEVAPGGTLRAVYLATNPAQAVRDPASGEIRGASADLARELAKRLNVQLKLEPSANPATVIEAIAKGDADIGFVAYAPERVGTVEFSQTYMLVQQSFIVPEHSPIKSVKDIDRKELRISGGKGDSITLYLVRNLKEATLVETDNTPADAKQKLAAHEIDAFGANRQRLTTMLRDMPGYRLLPDSLFGVTQTIAVPKGKPEALAEVNRFIDEVRTSGFLADAVKRGGIVGLDPAPAGYDKR